MKENKHALVIEELLQMNGPLRWGEIEEKSKLHPMKIIRAIRSLEMDGRVLVVDGRYALRNYGYFLHDIIDKRGDQKIKEGEYAYFSFPSFAEKYASNLWPKKPDYSWDIVIAELEELEGREPCISEDVKNSPISQIERKLMEAVDEFYRALCNGKEREILSSRTAFERKMYKEYVAAASWFEFLDCRKEAQETGRERYRFKNLGQLEAEITERLNSHPVWNEDRDLIAKFEGQSWLEKIKSAFYYLQQLSKDNYKRTASLSVFTDELARLLFDIPLLSWERKDYKKISAGAEIGEWVCGEMEQFRHELAKSGVFALVGTQPVDRVRILRDLSKTFQNIESDQKELDKACNIIMDIMKLAGFSPANRSRDLNKKTWEFLRDLGIQVSEEDVRIYFHIIRSFLVEWFSKKIREASPHIKARWNKLLASQKGDERFVA